MQLVLGGARSGKSRFAEQLAQQHAQAGLQVVYVATATACSLSHPIDSPLAHDVEMLARIAQHQADRPDAWQTVETPLNLATTLAQFNHPQYCILVDCLTLWTLNVLETEQLQVQTDALFAQLERMNVPLILVSNEIGLGVMPLGQLTREFVDALGRLHQRLAQRADNVTLMVAGLPLPLKTHN